jgi:hypothetical protein
MQRLCTARLKICASTSTNKQGIASENVFTRHKTHAAIRMPWGMQSFDLLRTKVQHVAVFELYGRRLDTTTASGVAV